jgi:hypothetical protein
MDEGPILLLLPLYILSDLLPLPKLNEQYIQTVFVWWGGGVELYSYYRPYSAGYLQSVSDQIQNLQNCFTTPNKYDQ